METKVKTEVAKLIYKFIEDSIESIFHIDEIENELKKQLGFSFFCENFSLFYSLIVLLKYGFVSDLIFNNKVIAENNFFSKKIDCPHIDAFEIWEEVIDENIRNKIKNYNISKIKKKPINSKIGFVNRPNIKVDTTFSAQEKAGKYGEKEVLKYIKLFPINNKFNQSFYCNYDVKFARLQKNCDLNIEHLFQTDFLIITNNKILVLEVKNYNGKIKIDTDSNCYYTNDYETDLLIKNPFVQNRFHVSDLNDLLYEKLKITKSIEVVSCIVFGKKTKIENLSNETNYVNFDGLSIFLENKLINDEDTILDAELVSILVELESKNILSFPACFNYNLFDALVEYNEKRKEELEIEILVEREKERYIKDNKIKEKFDGIKLKLKEEYKLLKKEREKLKTERRAIAEKANIEISKIEEETIKRISEEKKKSELIINDFKKLEKNRIEKVIHNYKKYNNEEIIYNVSFDGESFCYKGLLNFYLKCNHPYRSIFAVIHNFLIKNYFIDTKEEFFLKFDDEKYIFDIKEQKPYIFNVILVVLLLIKNNKYEINNNVTYVRFGYDYDKNHIKYALKFLNKYLEIFSKMIDLECYSLVLKYEENEDIKVGYDEFNDIFICKILNEQKTTNSNLWIEDNIQYKININEHRDSMEYILKNVFNLNNFRENQLENIIDILNSPANKLILMPTGSGKSLVYYFVAYLQPKFSFVISPTKLLIRNQIKNLQSIHKITNVKNIEIDNISTLNLNHINFITPEEMENDIFTRNMINDKGSVYSFILDEVHCLSMKSHNFRPEYLTLSLKLQKYYNKSWFFGFTATVDFQILKELQLELNVHEDNVRESSLIRKNVKYEFFSSPSINEMLSQCLNLLKKHKNERTIIFVKYSKNIKLLSDYLYENGKYDFLAYDNSDYSTFDIFSNYQNGYSTLITTTEAGVGIDIPNISNVIHFGIPFSLMDFAQQVGRGGRDGSSYSSYIISNEAHIEDSDNDYIESRECLNNYFKNREDESSILKDLVDNIENKVNQKLTYYETTKASPLSLLVLQKIGMITYWGRDNENYKISINPDINLYLLKGKFRDYIINNKDFSMEKNIANANSYQEIITLFFNYYIDSYLILKIRLLDYMNDIVVTYSNDINISDEIRVILDKHFSLPYSSLIKEEEYISELQWDSINQQYIEKIIDDNYIQKLSRINNFDEKLEYLRFICDLDKKTLQQIENKVRNIIPYMVDKLSFTQDFIEILKEKYLNKRDILSDFLINLMDLFDDNEFYILIMKNLNYLYGQNKELLQQYAISLMIKFKYKVEEKKNG